MPHLHLERRGSEAGKGLGFAEYEAPMRERAGLGWAGAGDLGERPDERSWGWGPGAEKWSLELPVGSSL